MKATTKPIFTGSVPGPWCVDTVGKNWCVIHSTRLTGKVIGPVSKGRGTNYFDRAIAEADRRNRKEKA